jgi:D-alanyl-lipoteichoic acid acyltransferase DltB (MBOAT superfamily)
LCTSFSYRLFNRTIAYRDNSVSLCARFRAPSLGLAFFLFLLVFNVLDYYTGIRIRKLRQHWVGNYLVHYYVNLGFLGIFKYYNFCGFRVIERCGISNKSFALLLNVILPVGISFCSRTYYVIDIYQRIKQNITLWNSLFVSYFPLLVTGPIEERPICTSQSKVKRTFDFSPSKGVYQPLWELVK